MSYNPKLRPVVQVALPWSLGGLAMPHVDDKDPETCLRGIQRRVCIKPPIPDKNLLDELKQFVIDFCEKHLTPLAGDKDYTSKEALEEWLSLTSYEAWRKESLRQTYDSIRNRTEKENFTVDGFIKDETYVTYKHARGIHARNDKAKVIWGPIFKDIEAVVMKLKYFIKKIPKPERAQYITDNIYVPGYNYLTSDYKSFESHFVEQILEAIELPMYTYMTKNINNQKEFLYNYNEYILGVNRISYRYFKLNIKATRMSGEMNTSLGNGFSNLMLLLFVMVKSGYTIDEIRAIIEGDDALAAEDPQRIIRCHLFKQLGFTIEHEIMEDLNEASFCGNIFDLTDKVIITDILETLTCLGWTKARYSDSNIKLRKGLLRSKALSLLYEYSGCPVLQAVAQRLIYLTQGVRPYNERSNEYAREELKQMYEFIGRNGLPNKEVKMNTRMLVQKLFKIPVEMQKNIERKCETMELEEVWLDEFFLMAPHEWKETYMNYTVLSRKLDRYTPILMNPPTELNNDFLTKLAI